MTSCFLFPESPFPGGTKSGGHFPRGLSSGSPSCDLLPVLSHKPHWEHFKAGICDHTEFKMLKYLLCITGKEPQPGLVLTLSPVEAGAEIILTSKFVLHLWPLKEHLKYRSRAGFVISLSSKICLWEGKIAAWAATVKHPVFMQSRVLQRTIRKRNKLPTATHCITSKLSFPCQPRFYKFKSVHWRISLWIRKTKREQKGGKLFHISHCCLLCYWGFKAGFQADGRSVFSEAEMYMGAHALSQNISLYLSAPISSFCLYFSEKAENHVLSPCCSELLCNWDNRVRLRGIESFWGEFATIERFVNLTKPNTPKSGAKSFGKQALICL